MKGWIKIKGLRIKKNKKKTIVNRKKKIVEKRQKKRRSKIRYTYEVKKTASLQYKMNQKERE